MQSAKTLVFNIIIFFSENRKTIIMLVFWRSMFSTQRKNKMHPKTLLFVLNFFLEFQCLIKGEIREFLKLMLTKSKARQKYLFLGMLF